MRLNGFTILILLWLISSVFTAGSFKLRSNRNHIQFKENETRLIQGKNDISFFIASNMQGNSAVNSVIKQEIVTKPPHKLSVHQFAYVVMTSIFITCLIVADVIGVKIFEFKLPFPILGHSSVEHTCGMLTFPITFLLGDIINEYYGPKATKQTVYLGLAMSILVFFVMNIAQAVPYLNKPFNGK